MQWIARWHRQEGLRPLLCREKEALLRTSPTVFYRATPGLFHLDRRGAFHALAQLLPRPCPHGLVSGDPHLGNYGSFRGPDGGPVFGLNDFDQLANDVPLSADLLRLATSVCLQATELRLTERAVRHCVRAAVTGWVEAVREASRGQQRSFVTAAEASRPVARLLAHVALRTQHDFVSGHCQRSDEDAPPCFHAHPLLKPLLGPARARVLAVVQAAARGFPPGFPVKRPLQVLDARWKLGSGGSSYGLPRAYLLVGAKEKDKPAHIIECKLLLPSLTRVPDARTSRSDAQGVLQAQVALGGILSRLAGHGSGSTAGFLVRELERHKAKLPVAALSGEELEEVAHEAGMLLGRSHTRSATQRRALRAWVKGGHVELEERVFLFAVAYRAQVLADLRVFRQALRARS